MNPTPDMLQAAWKAFRQGRPGTLLGPGPAFVEAITAALALVPDATAKAAEPPPGLLMSIALRLDHGLGCPGYYDQPMFAASGLTHQQRLDISLSDARKAWEECAGVGFYKPAIADRYVAMEKRARPGASIA